MSSPNVRCAMQGQCVSSCPSGKPADLCDSIQSLKVFHTQSDADAQCLHVGPPPRIRSSISTRIILDLKTNGHTAVNAYLKANQVRLATSQAIMHHVYGTLYWASKTWVMQLGKFVSSKLIRFLVQDTRQHAQLSLNLQILPSHCFTIM